MTNNQANGSGTGNYACKFILIIAESTMQLHAAVYFGPNAIFEL
jgi:hypothetical protein